MDHLLAEEHNCLWRQILHHYHRPVITASTDTNIQKAETVNASASHISSLQRPGIKREPDFTTKLAATSTIKEGGVREEVRLVSGFVSGFIFQQDGCDCVWLLCALMLVEPFLWYNQGSCCGAISGLE